MRIIADENCERKMIDALRKAGHDVVSILDMSPSMGDPEVFALAREESRVLLTSDRDFGLIAEHAAVRPPAIVLIRLERLSPARRIELVVLTLGELKDVAQSQFVVIEPHKVRARVYQP